MRPFKSLVSLPFAASLHLIWERITLNKITAFYSVFSFLHASLQIILQTEVFSINSQATNVIAVVVDAVDPPNPGFSILKKDELLWCHDPEKIPGSCSILWTMSNSTNAARNTTYYAASASKPSATQMMLQTPKPVPSAIAPSTATVAAQPGSTAILSTDQEVEIASQVISQENQAGVHARSTHLVVSGLPGVPGNQTLTSDCLTGLRWPLESLRNTKREDIVFLFFHVWVLGMSIVAILNESVVHMLATLVTHALLTAWSIFQILSTRSFQRNYSALITHGLCSSTANLLPTYWSHRTSVELGAAALNGTALLLSAFLTYRLVVTYNWATFKRIGADRRVSKAYKMVLTFSVALQLGLFFIVVSMALWIDQLCNGAIGMFALKMSVYRALYISVLICLVPWIVAGWRAVRLEHRLLMLGFLGFNLLLIGGWASMFASTTFRLTFVQWRFFSIMSVVAVTLTLCCLVGGIACRLSFGHDLKRRLSGHGSLPEGFVSAMPDDLDPNSGSDKDSMYSYEEKVAFPESTLPSFSRYPSNGSGTDPSAGTYGFYSQYPQYKAPSLARSNSAGSAKSSHSSRSSESAHSSRSAHSAKSGAGTISGPMIVPSSRFSMESSDGAASEVMTEVSHGHQRGWSGSGPGGRSKRWVIE